MTRHGHGLVQSPSPAIAKMHPRYMIGQKNEHTEGTRLFPSFGMRLRDLPLLKPSFKVLPRRNPKVEETLLDAATNRS